MFLRNARYRRIILFFAGLTLNIIFWDIFLRRIGLGFLGARSQPARYLGFARAYRRLAVELGGVLIKVGQFLSSRVDVLPEYITVELSGLQDEVPAAPFAGVRAVIEAEMQVVGFADASEKKADTYWKNTDITPDTRKKGGVK